MSKRHAMPNRKSKSLFSHTAGNQRVHPKNVIPQPLNRGGIRL